MPKYTSSGMKTIRGSLEIDVGSRPVEKLVFNYESQDRTRGWMIEGAWMWISDIISPADITADTNLNLYGNLASDTGSTGSPPTQNQTTLADENRNLAWFQKQFLARDAGNFYIPNSVSLTGCDFLIDFERIVTNDLYINAGALMAGGGDQEGLTVSYYIVLKEISVSPSQSLLQQLKGIGQNVDN